MEKSTGLIKKAFKDYFKGQLELPEPIPARGKIDSLNTGWMVRYILCFTASGEPFLDFTADHRMTNPRHQRIDRLGNISFLEMVQEGYAYDPDIPGDKEIKEADYFAYNRNVYRILKEKGLAEDI